MPLYVKSHSQGEYIFDHAFADAWHARAGATTPSCSRGALHPGDRAALPGGGGRRARADAGDARSAAQNGLSSAHVTFCTEAEAAAGARRASCTGSPSSITGRTAATAISTGSSPRSRRASARPSARSAAVAQGLRRHEIRALTGDAIRPEHWDAFWAFYQDTGARKWGTPYLTRAFFDRAHETMRDDVLLVLAERDGRPVAGR
jgi:uncharacterized protein